MEDIAGNIERQMTQLGDEAQARHLMRFFKTGKGEYGEGDRFLGIRVPVSRTIVRQWRDKADMAVVQTLLGSCWHEVRFVGFLLLVEIYKKMVKAGDDTASLIKFYISVIDRGNNWDLVDLVAPKILGDRVLRFPDDRTILYDLAERHGQLWHQRVAVVSTWTLIREHRYDEALNICTLYLDHPHDLIHKASGWMLREIGKRGGMRHLMDFLDAHAHRMPRTMLRYAIEKLSAEQRQYYLHYSGT